MSIYPNPMTAGQEPTPPDAEPGRTRADDGVGVRPAEIGRRPARTQDPIESERGAMIIATDGSNSPRRARRGGPIGRGNSGQDGPLPKIGSRDVQAAEAGSDPTIPDGEIKEPTPQRRNSNRRRANRLDAIPDFRGT